jgi:putative transposase
MGTRTPMVLSQGPNQRWSLDLVNDTLISGRRICVLVVVDDFTRDCLALVVDTSLSGGRVARELDPIIAVRGVPPLMIVSDNGTELTSLAIIRWIRERPVGSFNERLRDGCPNETLFVSLGHACSMLQPCRDDYRDDYNHVRPHIGMVALTPADAVRARQAVAACRYMLGL